MYFYAGIPTLDLASGELPSPLHNYAFATFFSILLVSACTLAPVSAIPGAVLEWGANTLLIMVAHPYTNNIAHLVVEKWCMGISNHFFPRSARAAGSREAVNRAVFGVNPPLSMTIHPLNRPESPRFDAI